MSILKKKTKAVTVQDDQSVGQTQPETPISILELDFGRADLNLLVEKLNEVIRKVNK